MDETITAITDAITIGDCNEIERLLAPLNPAEIAHVLNALPADERAFLFEYVPEGLNGEVLLHMGEVAAADLAKDLDAHTLLKATDVMDTADIAELLEVLPEESADKLLKGMDAQRRERIEINLSFEEGTAGRLMHTDAITVRSDVTLQTLQRYLRRYTEVPEDTDMLMVVDRDNHLQGTISILSLVLHPPDKAVTEVMKDDVRTLSPDTPEHEVIRIFEDHDLVSAPVVDQAGYFLGRVVVDDIIDSMRDEADHAMLSPVGLKDDEDLFAPMLPSARRRTVWLAVNLGTALLASWVIGQFEATLDKIVALAVLMPIVASMGGIAGSQTLTLTIRGLTMGQVVSNNSRWLLKKEMGIGMLNGVLWALVVALIALLWFKSWQIGMVIGAALTLNMLAAALAGILVPVAFHRMKIDPALAGAVVLTTVTDVVGFMAFLGLATIFLL
ncbi:MAG: magnesium transporter [Thermodesulfobacteriota bacterium]